MKVTAVYPGTFDPITNGHVDIAERAARIFDELIVGVSDHSMKSVLFSIDERLRLTNEALSHIKNVQVQRYGSLTVNFAKEQGAGYIVRGLRALSDFEWELQLSLTNHLLEPEVETVCLMASQEFLFLSSSILKEIYMNGGSIDHLTPAAVVETMKQQSMVDENGNSRVKVVSVRD